jgi:uncharacterized membrane protein
MSGDSHDLVQFLGRFHPGLVHLPIGGLVLLGTLELLAKFPRFKGAAQNNPLILALTVAVAVPAALLGWMLSLSGDYDPQLLQWHQWTGFAVAASCVLTFLLSRLGRLRAYRLSLLVTLAVLVVASHFGASITHGRGFLARYAPGPLRSLFQVGAGTPVARPTKPDPLPSRVFADVVRPILLQRCSPCHGPEKQKADLRVDSLEVLLKGGKDGPALVPGKAKDSRLIQRLLLPLNNDDHMPPEGKPQPTPAEITLLEWWIESGAPADGPSAGGVRP